MSETTKTTAQPPTVAALLAEFDTPDELLAACQRVRDAGYRRWDAHSPYPVHGIDRAMGIRPTVLPWLVLGAGLTGCAVALLMQWWMNAVNYPLVISGKPLFSLPANIPVTFELIVLFSALTAFFGVLALNGLPRFWHPVFHSKQFLRATTDGFFISITADDPKFDASGTRTLLESTGALAVEACYEPAESRSLPTALWWAAAAGLAVALVPPAAVALMRAMPASQPRIHLVQDMDFQPRYNPQSTSSFFRDRRTMRPDVPGTIAQGQFIDNEHLVRGIVDDQWAGTFPMPVSRATIERGQQRYNVYCATCHGLGGDGDGMTAKRAADRLASGHPGFVNWVAPRSLHAESVVRQPVGEVYNTIANGKNAMAAYAAQISVEDRWAIVAYVKALQRARNARLDDVPEQFRSEMR